MTTTNAYTNEFVRCDSPDGWSLHAPGSTDEQIATGDAPPLVSGEGEPTAEDYARATEAHIAEQIARGRDGLVIDIGSASETSTGVEGAIDVDVTVDGVEGEVTLLLDHNGDWTSWGAPDNWVSGRLLRIIQARPDARYVLSALAAEAGKEAALFAANRPTP